MDFSYRTRNVCSMQIDFHLEGDVVTNVRFTGGCNGNLKAISKLVEGMTVDQIERYLKGNICGSNTTSCADQLAIAVRQAWNRAHCA